MKFVEIGILGSPFQIDHQKQEKYAPLAAILHKK